LAKLTPADLVADGLDASTAQLLCDALDDLKPMSVHLNSNNKNSPTSCTFVQMPPSTLTSLSPPPVPLPVSLPPLLDAALMTVVQQQQQQPSRTLSLSSSERNQFDSIFINLAGVHPSLSSSPSPKLPKPGVPTGAPTGGTNNIPPPPLPLPPPSTSNCPSQTQHHVPLLTAHSFLYNPAEPYIFPIAIPPGFPSTTPDFMR
ncbi:unnamed protein product, partial [Adineta steineri]